MSGVQYYGDFPEDHVAVRIPFNTFDSNDPTASVTITNLADADIKVHKDGSLTEIATDGASVVINFDSITGNHIILIDTSAHADYSTGSEYQVRIEGTTVDGGTINAFVGCFSIERAGGTIALIRTLLSRVIGTLGTGTHNANGSNLTEAGGTGDQLTAINLPNQTMDITGNITGNLSGSVGSVSALASNVITTASINDGAITAAKLGSDCITNAKIADNAIAVENIANDTITAAKFDETTAFPLGAADTGATQVARTGADGDTLETVSDQLDTLTTGVALNDDAITAAKFDETTAFPLKADDSGNTYVARTGADGDTLETLSDQIDGVSAGVSPTLLNDTTISSITNQTIFVIAAGSDVDDAYLNMAVVFYDISNSDFPSPEHKCTGYVGSTRTMTIDAAPNFTIANGQADKVKVFQTAPGTTAPTSDEVADKVWDEAKSGHVAGGSFGEEVQSHSLSTELAPVALDGGAATIGGMLTKMSDDNNGASFDAETDSLRQLNTAIQVGAPTNNVATGQTVTSGTIVSGGWADTATDNGVKFQVAPDSAPIDVELLYNIGTDKIDQILLNGYWDGAANYANAFLWNYNTSSFDQISDTGSRMNNEASDMDYFWIANQNHHDTNAPEGAI